MTEVKSGSYIAQLEKENEQLKRQMQFAIKLVEEGTRCVCIPNLGTCWHCQLIRVLK